MEHVEFQSNADPRWCGWFIVYKDVAGEGYDAIGAYDTEAFACALIREAEVGLYPDATSCTGCA